MDVSTWMIGLPVVAQKNLQSGQPAGAKPGQAVQGTAPPGAVPHQEAPSPWGSFIMIGVIFVVFYLFIILPQQRKTKKHREFVASLKPGQRVITSSGIYGTITDIDEHTVTLRVDKQTTLRVLRDYVAARAQDDPKKDAETVRTTTM